MLMARLSTKTIPSPISTGSASGSVVTVVTVVVTPALFPLATGAVVVTLSFFSLSVSFLTGAMLP